MGILSIALILKLLVEMRLHYVFSATRRISFETII